MAVTNRPSTPSRRIAAILNCDGGTLKSMDVDALISTVREAFETAGHEIEIDCIGAEALTSTLQLKSQSDDFDTLIVAGGDGTASAGAAAAWRGKKSFGVLPAGTMNLFARSFGTPLDLDSAIDVLSRAREKTCDIATANGRPFIHQFAVGLHPRAMKIRDRLDFDSRYGKMIASARAMLQVVGRPVAFRVELGLDGKVVGERLSALSVSNNRFGEGHLPYADRLDEGVLGVYTSRARSPWQMTKLVGDILRGRWSGNRTVEEKIAQSVTLHFPKKRTGSKAVIDGEVIALEDEIDIRIHPRELTVLVGDDI